MAGPGVFDAIDDYAGATPQSDDITLMLLQLPPAPPARATVGNDSVSRSFSRGNHLVSRAQDWLQQNLETRYIAPEVQMELALVAEEIITNIDKYADLHATATIELELQSSAGSISLLVKDNGVAFNPLQDSQRSPLGADIDSAEIGGLGVHLITQLTDQQDYHREDGCNVLRVTRYLPTDTAR